MPHRVLIIGGGFGGIAAARHLAKRHRADISITLVTDTPWMEYDGVLYRLLRGGPASQACIPLPIVVPKNVTTIIDRAESIDPAKKSVKGKKASYTYDTLILAPGAEPAYFGIPGMQEHAMSMASVPQALKLRDAVEHIITGGKGCSIAIIGGGATGVEISSELLPYAQSLARARGVDLATIRVDLIEGSDRLLPPVPPDVAERVLQRLRQNGVNVRLQTAVASASEGAVTLKNGETVAADIIVWTAGVQASSFIASIPGLELDKKKRAVVDEHLRAKGSSDIFILGDSAATQFSGMAQTAYEDGKFVARCIAAELEGQRLPVYEPKAPAYAIPVGRGWAAVKFLSLKAYGFPGYILRRAADIHVYMLIMQWRFVGAAFFGRINLKKYGIST